jgi:hypothetical protein
VVQENLELFPLFCYYYLPTYPPIEDGNPITPRLPPPPAPGFSSLPPSPLSPLLRKAKTETKKQKKKKIKDEKQKEKEEKKRNITVCYAYSTYLPTYLPIYISIDIHNV